MTRHARLALLAIVALAGPLAHAKESCSFGVAPETSGFPLNPVLKRLVVTSATASCAIRKHDEILQVGIQPVPGERALKVMKYWKSLKEGVPIPMKVRRDGALIAVVVE